MGKQRKVNHEFSSSSLSTPEPTLCVNPAHFTSNSLTIILLNLSNHKTVRAADGVLCLHAEHGRVKQACHMHPAQASMREDCVVTRLLEYWIWITMILILLCEKTMWQAWVKQACHMYPVQASTRDRERIAWLHACWNTGSGSRWS